MTRTKKICLFLAAVLAAAPLSAQTSMRFVKLLSHPVGVFARVDVTGSDPVVVGNLNVGNRFVFANTILVAGGNATTKGFTSPTLTLTKPANAPSSEVAKLKGSIANFNVNSVNVKSGGKFEGGSLNAASLHSPKMEVKQALYVNNKNVQTNSAWFAGLNMPNKAILEPVGPEEGDLVSTTWKAVDLGGTCLDVGSGANAEDCAAKLLVADIASSTSAERCANASYREQHKVECCCAFGNDYTDEICWTRRYPEPFDCVKALCQTESGLPNDAPECQVECTVLPGSTGGTCEDVKNGTLNVCTPGGFSLKLLWNKGPQPDDPENSCHVQEIRYRCIAERNGYTCE